MGVADPHWTAAWTAAAVRKSRLPFSPLGPYVPCDIRREVTHGDSRFDLAFSLRDRDTKAVSPAFMEVKGVTLEENELWPCFLTRPRNGGIKP